MKVLFDVNIVLDFFFNRMPWADDAEAALRPVASEQITGLLCATGADHLYYIGRRLGGREKAHRAVEICLQLFEIAPVDAAVLKMAIQLSDTDFEDNIVLASGIRAGADLICTRDGGGFRSSPVQVLTAKQLAEQICIQ